MIKHFPIHHRDIGFDVARVSHDVAHGQQAFPVSQSDFGLESKRLWSAWHPGSLWEGHTCKKLKQKRAQKSRRDAWNV
jgi:hypothetical protein